MLEPSEEFLNDMVSYLNSKRKEPIEKNASISSVPTKSALEAGSKKKVNENFKVFIRVRPMLKREINSESCIKVEDVKDFPRTPPPQRIYVKDPSMLNIVRGNYVFNRVFVEKATQDEVFLSVASPLIHALVNDKKNVTIVECDFRSILWIHLARAPQPVATRTAARAVQMLWYALVLVVLKP